MTLNHARLPIPPLRHFLWGVLYPRARRMSIRAGLAREHQPGAAPEESALSDSRLLGVYSSRNGSTPAFVRGGRSRSTSTTHHSHARTRREPCRERRKEPRNTSAILKTYAAGATLAELNQQVRHQGQRPARERGARCPHPAPGKCPRSRAGGRSRTSPTEFKVAVNLRGTIVLPKDAVTDAFRFTQGQSFIARRRGQEDHSDPGRVARRTSRRRGALPDGRAQFRAAGSARTAQYRPRRRSERHAFPALRSPVTILFLLDLFHLIRHGRPASGDGTAIAFFSDWHYFIRPLWLGIGQRTKEQRG